ncbi:MAG: DUF6020 family protein [Eubacteriales bacterium]|nr:DUF6020 family protein [Eubacteriales bacterium]
MENSIGELRSRLQKPAAIILWFLAALLCTKAFVINPELYAGKSAVPAATTDYVWSFVGLCLTGLFYLTFTVRRYRPKAGELLLGLLFGVANYFGTTLFAYDSWAFLGTTVSWPQAAFKCLGQGFTMIAALTLITGTLSDGVLRRKGHIPFLPPQLRRLRTLYGAHTVGTTMVVLLLCWLPYLIAYFPGTPNYDIAQMMEQFFGLAPMTTWHGVFLTWLLGGLVTIGRALGSDNIGAALFTLLQVLVLASVCGFNQRALKQLGLRPLWQLFALAFFAITPFFGFYAEMICKDTLYSALLLLFTLQTLHVVRERNGLTPKALLFYGLSGLFCFLLRNNGLYVVAPVALCVILFGLKGKERLKVGAALGSAIAVALFFTHVVIPGAGITDTTASGLYSVCFQQTARVARDHYDELTPEERTAIDEILDLEQIRYIYEPWISDPVKYTFRQFGQGVETEKAALANYRKLWLEQLQKYPQTYLEAFMAGNNGYYAFTPMYEGMTYSQQAGARIVLYPYTFEGEGQFQPVQLEALDPLRRLLSSWAQRWRTFPMLAMLYVIPFYTWQLIGGGLALCHQKRWRELIVYLPALLSFGVCLLSPANDYFRYYLPIVMSTPLLLTLSSAPDPRS